MVVLRTVAHVVCMRCDAPRGGCADACAHNIQHVSPPPPPPLQVFPEAGTVCFSAGLHGWAFTLTVFAKLYAKKFGEAPLCMLRAAGWRLGGGARLADASCWCAEAGPAGHLARARLNPRDVPGMLPACTLTPTPPQSDRSKQAWRRSA